jgi:ribosomal protein S18 acetylase RimI-like enzyme
MVLLYEKCSLLDLPELAKISRDTFKTAFEKDNKPADFTAYLDKAFNEAQLKKELKNSATHFYWVKNKDRIIGYFKINEASAQSDFNKEGTLEVERIYVLEQYQGNSYGRQMIEFIIAYAKTEKLTAIWLGVWEHNTNAIRFYNRYGFNKTSEHPYWVGTDKQTDHIMTLHL